MIKKRSALSNEENLKLIIKAQEEYLSSGGKKQEFMQKAMEHNMGMVYHVFNSYQSLIKSYKSEDEILSYCIEQLFKCIITYNPAKNAKFATYVAVCVGNSIKMELRKCRRAKKNVSLNKTIGYDHDGCEKQLQDVLEDQEVMDLENKVLENVNRQLLYQKLPLFLTEKQIELLRLRMQGDYYIEISSKLGNSRSYYNRLMNQMEKFVKQLSILKNVTNIDEYIKTNALSGNAEKETRVRYAFSKYIFSNQKIDFDYCFDYIKYPLKEKGMLKKVDSIFENRKNSDRIYYTLANLNNVDIDALRQQAKAAWKVFTSPKERQLNDELIDLGYIAGLIKKDKIGQQNSFAHDLKNISHLAFLEHFSPNLSPVIKDLQKSFDKTSKLNYNTSKQKIIKAEKLAEKQLEQ